jgi:hypothetical protein
VVQLGVLSGSLVLHDLVQPCRYNHSVLKLCLCAGAAAERRARSRAAPGRFLCDRGRAIPQGRGRTHARCVPATSPHLRRRDSQVPWTRIATAAAALGIKNVTAVLEVPTDLAVLDKVWRADRSQRFGGDAGPGLGAREGARTGQATPGCTNRGGNIVFPGQ